MTEIKPYSGSVSPVEAKPNPTDSTLPGEKKRPLSAFSPAAENSYFNPAGVAKPCTPIGEEKPLFSLSPKRRNSWEKFQLNEKLQEHSEWRNNTPGFSRHIQGPPSPEDLKKNKDVEKETGYSFRTLTEVKNELDELGRQIQEAIKTERFAPKGASPLDR